MEWGKNLETGYARIDDDHADLVRTVSDIMSNIRDNDDVELLKEKTTILLYDFLHHVCTEEFIMMATGYSDYKKHKSEHDRFINSLTESERDSPHNQGSYCDLCIFVIRFFFLHIENYDKPLADSLKLQHLSGLVGPEHEHDIERLALELWRDLKAECDNKTMAGIEP